MGAVTGVPDEDNLAERSIVKVTLSGERLAKTAISLLLSIKKMRIFGKGNTLIEPITGPTSKGNTQASFNCRFNIEAKSTVLFIWNEKGFSNITFLVDDFVTRSGIAKGLLSL